MRRGKPLRSRSGKAKRPAQKSAYRQRDRDTAYMLWVKTLECCAARDLGLTDCRGPIEADHAGRRGMGRKCSDKETIPLCQYHHYGSRGAIIKAMDWTRDQMRPWLDRMIEETQASHSDSFR